MKLPPIKIYWRCWLGILLTAFVVKIGIACVFPKTNTSLFVLIYIIAIWLPIMVLNLLESRSLAAYIQASQKERWPEISRAIGQGKRWKNGFRFLGFLKSDEDFGDPEISRRKLRYKSFIKFVLFAFVAFPVVAGLLSI
jgi:hypothetical protein